MSKHTPAPWRVGQDGSFGISIWAKTADDESFVADVKTDVRETRVANANLIAAAPDLLAALAELLSATFDGISAAGRRPVDAERVERAMESAHAAIAKAEGRS